MTSSSSCSRARRRSISWTSRKTHRTLVNSSILLIGLAIKSIAPAAKAKLQIDGIGLDRDHDDGNVPKTFNCLDLTTCLDAVRGRHHDVHENEIDSGLSLLATVETEVAERRRGRFCSQGVFISCVCQDRLQSCRSSGESSTIRIPM